MPQLNIRLDARTAEKLSSAANAAGLSESAWVAELIQRHTSAQWPDAALRLAGAWRDFPDAYALRSTLSHDAPREAPAKYRRQT